MMPINVSDVTNWLKSQQQFNQIALEWEWKMQGLCIEGEVG